MALKDFATRMFGYNPFDNTDSTAPVSGSVPSMAQPTLDQMYQQDLQQAQMDRVGNLGMMLMAAGQQLTPAQRATILAQAPQYMDGAQRDAMTAAQARLYGMTTKSKQDELARQEELRKQAPEIAKQLGLSDADGRLLDPDSLQKLRIAQLSRDPKESEFKQAQINNLNRPDKVNPQMVDLPDGGKGWVNPGSTDIMPIGGAGKGLSQEPKKTEAEAKNYQFAQQSIDAYKKLADPEYQYALTSRTQQLANTLPFFSSPWSSDDYRSGDAASSAMTDAILRNKSGATIHDPEIQDEIRRVIPQPGDTQEQLRDKVYRQQLMIDGFIGAANPADRKALREQFDQANKSLMNKYQKNNPQQLPPGISIRRVN